MTHRLPSMPRCPDATMPSSRLRRGRVLLVADAQPLNLWRLCKHPRVSAGAAQHLAAQREPWLRSVRENYVARIAAGVCGYSRMPMSARVAVAEAARALRALPPRESRLPTPQLVEWLFAPMPAADAARLRRVPFRGHRLLSSPGNNAAWARDRAYRGDFRGDPSGVYRTAFTSFTAARVGARCWDHWKQETRMPLHREVLEHFGLAADPFGRPRRAEDRWTSPALDRVERQLREAVLRGPLCMLKGPSGGGKSQMLRHVLADLDAEKRIVICRLLTPDTRTVSQFSLIYAVIRDASEALGLPLRKPTGVEIGMARLRDLARACAARSRRLVVVVEESHGLSHQVFTLAKRITESALGASGGADLLTFVFVGQDDASAGVTGVGSLDAYLADPGHREVVERLDIVTVTPLSPQSLRSYVGFRLAQAGGSAERLLEDGWAAAVTRALPRERLVPQAVDRLLSDAMRRVHAIEETRPRPRRRLGPADIDAAALNPSGAPDTAAAHASPPPPAPTQPAGPQLVGGAA